jgi:hypothetical protein
MSGPPRDETSRGDDASADTRMAECLSAETVGTDAPPASSYPADGDFVDADIYVATLAVLVASKRTAIPLSIALFGAEGSGKSYLMGLLRSKLDEIMRSDETSAYRNVVQISFNAWHYVDADLWAVFGDRIFGVLAGLWDIHDDQQLTSEAQLRETKRMRKELEAATARAQTEAIRLREEIAGRRRSARDWLRDLAQAAAAAPKMKQIWSRLGVNGAVEQGAMLADEIRGVRADLNVWKRVVAGRRGLVLATFLVVAVVLAIAALADWTRAGAWLSACLGALTLMLGVATNGVRLVHSALHDLTEVAGSIGTAPSRRRLSSCVV